MTVTTVTPDRLEELAYDHPGTPITLGTHTASVTIHGDLYIARLPGPSKPRPTEERAA